MAENKSGIHSIISTPVIYNMIQWIAGAKMYREKMVTDYIKPFDGCKILDIGCGTGEYIYHIKRHSKDFEYYGFDGEGVYIDYAKKLFEGQSNIHFYHKILTEESIKEFNNFDIVIATGVMHHLDDPIVVSLLKLSKLALKPGGRLVTYDPGKYENMSFLEKFFVKYDRGRSIRYENEYAGLVKQVFQNYKAYSPYLTYYNSRNIVFDCINN